MKGNKKNLNRSDYFIKSKAVKIPIKEENKKDLNKKISEMINIYDFGGK